MPPSFFSCKIDLTGVIELMNQQFKTEHSFDKDFAQEAFFGLSSQMMEVHAMPIDTLLDTLRGARNRVYYCTNCGGVDVCHVRQRNEKNEGGRE